MKIRAALLLVPVLLALFAGAALAKPVPAKLDPHFGSGGGTIVNTPPLEGRLLVPGAHLAVAPSNKSYVQFGPSVFGFGANGKPDSGFGAGGKVTVAPKTGKLVEVTGDAVDSQGRVLVAGTFEPVPGLKEKTTSGLPAPTLELVPVVEAFVLRYLPNGSLDPTFGSGGEVDTTFGAPRPLGTATQPAEYERPAVHATQIAVDAADRPVIAAKFVQRVEGCFYKNAVDQAFVTRLNSNGTLDTGFGSGGRAQIPSETAIALTGTPANGWATFSGPEVCEHGLNGVPTTLSALTDAGAANPILDPARPTPSAAEGVLAVDPRGRILLTEVDEGGTVPARVVRLRANGDLDQSFGHGGAVGLKSLGAGAVQAVGVDHRGRIVVGFGSSAFEITRLSSKGKIETKFGNEGVLRSKFSVPTALQAIAFDSKGRIVAAGWGLGPDESRKWIGIARFVPGS
jgi:uncharacterized delta-60 repeat protein